MPEPTPQPTPVAPEPEPKPVEVPSKFKKPDGSVDTDALVKSYVELEKKSSTPKPEPSKPTPTAEPKDEGLAITTAEPGTELTVEDIFKRTGLDPKATSEKWVKNGKLDAADYQAFGRGGWGKDIVDMVFQGQAALAEVAKTKRAGYVKDAEGVAGGANELEVLRAWARGSMDSKRLAQLNDVLNSNESFYADYIGIINAEYKKANGGASPMVSATMASKGGSSNTAAKDSKDFNAIVRDMQSPDPAARAIAQSRFDATTPEMISSWSRTR